jgi:hypothetical protein
MQQPCVRLCRLVADDGDMCWHRLWHHKIIASESPQQSARDVRSKQRRGMDTDAKIPVRGDVDEKIGRVGLSEAT